MYEIAVFIAQWILAPWAFIAACVAVGVFWGDIPLKRKEFAQITIGWPWVLALTIYDAVRYGRSRF